MATNNIVKQIALNSDQVPYDIQAKQLNPITTIGADNVTTTDEENTSIVFINGSTKGRIKLNSKGNISLESDTKHVNIEAAKGIQIKPTTNIIFDSSRRIDAGKGNEVHLQFLDDDFSDRGSSYDGDQYAEVKYEGRNHDIRCYEHGGIALQIAGADSGSYENKVKFEGKTYPISGFVGLLKEGSYKKAGFTLIRRNRVIIGGDDENLFKPTEIFGSANSFTSFRFVYVWEAGSSFP